MLGRYITGDTLGCRQDISCTVLNMSQSHIEELTAGFDFEKLRVCKERYEDSKGYKCGTSKYRPSIWTCHIHRFSAEAVSIISGGLSKASSVIASVDDGKYTPYLSPFICRLSRAS